MYYVTMKDRFMSGWGRCEGKDNILVFECANEDEALIVADNANSRGDQEKVRIRTTMPGYDTRRHLVQIKTSSDCPSWYEEGYF